MNACMPRSREALKLLLESFHVETAEKYRKADVTGDGIPETWCNRFLSDVTAALECPIPFLLANAQVAWLKEVGPTQGWRMVDAHEALECVNKGLPVAAGWANPKGGHGHVAIGSPSDEPGLHLAQAGVINFTCRPASRGFGLIPYACFAHD